MKIGQQMTSATAPFDSSVAMNAARARDERIVSNAELSMRFQREVLPLRDTLLRAAKRLTYSHADAEDLLQDALVDAYIGFRTFQQGTNLKAWLFRILRNRSISNHGKKKRRPEYLAAEITDQMMVSNAANLPRSPRSAEAEVLAGLPDGEITTALAALHEGVRTTLYYAAVEGYRYHEIAAIMDIPLGTVMSRLHRGRSRLRDLL
jgi:RNA polymerase sigma-70 factor (ECF subfamily)